MIFNIIDFGSTPSFVTMLACKPSCKWAALERFTFGLHTRRMAQGEPIPEEIAMRPYSTDLRERVVDAVDHKEGSLRQIARRFRVSLSSVVRLLQRRRDGGTIEPKPHGGGPACVLGPDDRRRLAALIEEQPDATLEQLKRRGGFTCSLKTLWHALRQQGLTRKKKTLHAD